MTIKILITGGTIDKIYNHLNGALIFKKSHILDMLKQSRCTLKTKIQTLFLKDSLDMNRRDREKIIQVCKKTIENKIVILHGTDTITETAKILGKSLNDKTIVLIGAMIPYSFGGSDALFNLGGALSAVQFLPNGVYIFMNGRIFSWDNVHKNKDIGEFCTKV